MSVRRGGLLLTGLLVLVVITGCGDSSGGAVVPSSSTPSIPPLSSTDLPTPSPPGKPPKSPSDRITPGWTSGTVSRGGTGPCYGLVRDDGSELALWSTAGLDLVEGRRVRVRMVPSAARVDCGDGQPMRLLEVEPG